MNLRQHIDIAVDMGTPLETAVKVNYIMGKGHKEHDEENLSLLKKKELKILYEKKKYPQAIFLF